MVGCAPMSVAGVVKRYQSIDYGFDRNSLVI